MSGKNKAVRAASSMMMITLIGKILGLFREQLLARNYAVGMESSAFMTASQIPRIFFDAVFASAISASFIPIFNEYLQKRGKEEAFRLSNNFITLVGIFTILLTSVAIIFAPQLTNLFADGFDEETAMLCTQLLRWLLPTIVFTGIAFSFVGVLQSMGEFGIPAAMSIASNGIVIIYFLFFNHKFGIFGLTAAFLLGWAMQALIQIPPMIKRGYIYRPRIDLKDEGLKKILLLMLPVMVSTWIQPINLSISLKYASRLFQGSGVSAINYANTLYTISTGVFVLSVANVIFPELSRLISDNKIEEFSIMIHRTLRILFFILIPMTVGLMILSEDIVRMIYQYGKFDDFSTNITAKALFFFAVGMLGFGMQTILSRAFYAFKDGKMPLISGIVSIVINYIACIFLVDKYNVAGLAFASAISTTAAALVLYFPMRARIRTSVRGEDRRDLTYMIISSIVMAICILIVRWVVASILPSSVVARILIVCLPTAVGILVYMLLSWKLGIGEAKYVSDAIKRKLKRSVNK